MRDYITLGTAPVGEESAQLGDPDYRHKVRDEAERYTTLLRKMFGEEPEGAKLALKGFSHDFGTYHEVVCYYDDENEVAEEYALNIECNLPEYWES